MRERLKAGDSDGGVRDFVVAPLRRVRAAAPGLARHTALLWLAPVLVLAAGAAGLGLAARRRRARAATVAPLSSDEAASVEALLARRGGS